MTKIQKESNSQRLERAERKPLRCCDLWQRYKKKAIHNVFQCRNRRGGGVVTYDKDTKRKQFTTIRLNGRTRSLVLWPMTKIQKESNSQHARRIVSACSGCCDLWQRYKKKAIHNRFEGVNLKGAGVVTYDKDTKRKQFTTGAAKTKRELAVLWPMTKIQKESNSQPCNSLTSRSPRCCDLWQRYKKKAIHNSFFSGILVLRGVVTCDKDTKIHDRSGKHLAW